MPTGRAQRYRARAGATYLTSYPNAAMWGYCCLVLNRHAVELYELSDEEGGALIDDIRPVAVALCEITGCVKLNYEIHGNTIPHLHVHFYPRYRGDPFEGGLIDRRIISVSPYQGEEYAEFCSQLKAPQERLRLQQPHWR